MSRIEDILVKVRDTLNDHDKDRWSDEVLLRLMDEGQKDIARQTGIFKDQIAVPLRTGEHTYSIPDDTITVLRATYNNAKLKMVTTDYMDKRGLTGQVLSDLGCETSSRLLNTSRNSHWASSVTETDILAIVYDKLNRHRLRVWPTPVSDDLEESLLELDSLYGITVSIDTFAMLGGYGIVSTIIDTDETLTVYKPDEFGMLTTLLEQAAVVLYRTKLTRTLLTTDDELELDSCWDEALRAYVVGKAFRNDVNAQNRALGDSELALYSRELARLQEETSKNSVSNDSFTVEYNGMGE